MQFQIFENLINKENEKYKIIFSIKDKSFFISWIKKIDERYFLVDKKERNKLKSIISEGKNYLEKNSDNILFGIEYSTKDHFKAVQLSIDKLSKDLDIYHLGYNNKHYKLRLIA